MQAVDSLAAAFALAADTSDEVCIIGGGEIYALALPLATHVYLTHVDTLVGGADVFFPRLDMSLWRETTRAQHPADAAHAFAFTFVSYERV